MSKFHPNTIRRLVFDLNSLASEFTGEGWKNFQSFIKVFDERAFNTVLIGENVSMLDWQTYSNVSVLSGATLAMLEQNRALAEPEGFWITDDIEIQSILSNLKQPFAGGHADTYRHSGMQYQNLYDLLEVFNPSRNTVQELADTILKLKEESPRMPLTLGIGGPDDCGHAFFIGELVEVMEARNQLIAGLDLLEQIGIEFQKETSPLTYWRSTWTREWVLERVMTPFARGKELVIEKVPEPLSAYEVTPFPFYLAPEMVLLVWGSTLFLPEFSEIIDIRILLELSEQAATSRAFSFDERENFDPSFIYSYQSSEGGAYAEYLKQYDVAAKVDYRIDFDNFHAFRLKETRGV